MITHSSLLYIVMALEILGVLFLGLFSFLKLHGKLRIFIIGLFVFLLVDAVEYGAKQISMSTGAFDTNNFGVQIAIFAIQGIVLSLCAYIGVKIFVNFSYRYRDFITIGAGAAAFKLVDAFKDHFGYLQLLLGNYTVTEGGLTAEQYRQNADALLQIPITYFAIALFEVLLTAAVIILSAYLASSALNREDDSRVYIVLGAGVYVVYQTVYWALYRFVSPWLGLAVGLAAAVGSVIVLRNERE